MPAVMTGATGSEGHQPEGLRMEHHQQPVALVVGAAGGIGTRVCEKLADQGWKVYLAGRTRSSLEVVSATLPSAAICVTDASNFAQVDETVDDIIAAEGHLDAAVNLAGSLLLKPAHRTSQEELTQTLTNNLVTAFAVVRAAARTMMDTGGSIVLTSSAAANIGLHSHDAIAAAKAGINGLVRSAASSYAQYGIRVNAVAPGLTTTPLTADLVSREAQAEASRQMHALGRLGTPDDVASAITWLVGSESSWVTAQTVGIDGGLGQVVPRPRRPSPNRG